MGTKGIIKPYYYYILIILILIITNNNYILTSGHTGAIAPVCTHFLNMRDIILIGDDNIMLLS